MEILILRPIKHILVFGIMNSCMVEFEATPLSTVLGIGTFS